MGGEPLKTLSELCCHEQRYLLGGIRWGDITQSNLHGHKETEAREKEAVLRLSGREQKKGKGVNLEGTSREVKLLFIDKLSQTPL